MIGGAGNNWTRDETILAYALLRFTETWPTDLQIAHLAKLLERSDGAVSFKLGNLRAAETEGKEGLPHRSQMDELVVQEFMNQPARLAGVAASIRSQLSKIRS